MFLYVFYFLKNTLTILYINFMIFNMQIYEYKMIKPEIVLISSYHPVNIWKRTTMDVTNYNN